MAGNRWQLRVMEFDKPEEYSIMTATMGYFSLAAMINLSSMTGKEWVQNELCGYHSRDESMTARIVPENEPILKNSKDTNYSI